MNVPHGEPVSKPDSKQILYIRDNGFAGQARFMKNSDMGCPRQVSIDSREFA
jgi:hypothetical protein